MAISITLAPRLNWRSFVAYRLLVRKKRDEFWLEGLPAQSRMFGLEDCQPLRPDRWLNEGDVVNVGNVALQVLHCPGHTPGHVVFLMTPPDC